MGFVAEADRLAEIMQLMNLFGCSEQGAVAMLDRRRGAKTPATDIAKSASRKLMTAGIKTKYRIDHRIKP